MHLRSGPRPSALGSPLRRLALALVGLIGLSAGAADLPRFETRRPYEVRADVSYDAHERTKLDLYLPEAAGPRPLVLYFHGGGFVQGSKRALCYGFRRDIAKFLDAGIAVACVEYRFRKPDDRLGLRVPLGDAVRSLQFLRLHAAEWGLDPDRVASFGESAGAGISLYLGFHDDMAEPGAADPVRRQSTRLRCLGTYSAQASYDLLRWREFVPGLRWVFFFNLGRLKDQAARFYGYPNFDVFKPHEREVRDLDMLAMIDPGDPPSYIYNARPAARMPRTEGEITHHPRHAVALCEALRKAGVPFEASIAAYSGKYTSKLTLADFLIRNLQP